MNESLPKKSSSFLIIPIGLVFFTVVILSLIYNPLMKSVKNVPLTNQLNNGKQIYIALFKFAEDHDGLFPCDETGPAATAEDCFNQLISGGYLEDEGVFWSKENRVLNTVSRRESNNDGILTANENTWGYVMGLTTESRTNIPIIFDSSTEAGVFNTSVWEGQAIVVKVNGSSQAMSISYGGGSPLNEYGSGKVGQITENNKDIFQRVPEGCKILPPQLAK